VTLLVPAAGGAHARRRSGAAAAAAVVPATGGLASWRRRPGPIRQPLPCRAHSCTRRSPCLAAPMAGGAGARDRDPPGGPLLAPAAARRTSARGYGGPLLAAQRWPRPRNAAGDLHGMKRPNNLSAGFVSISRYWKRHPARLVGGNESLFSPAKSTDLLTWHLIKCA
jgi:hypothetical protein